MAVVIVTRALIPVVEMNKALAMKLKGLILMTGSNPVLWEVLSEPFQDPKAGSAQLCSPVPRSNDHPQNNQTNKKSKK